MNRDRSQDDEMPYEEYDRDEPTFQRVRKQTGKATTTKDDRRQQGKEWGRAHHKFHKQRERNDKP